MNRLIKSATGIMLALCAISFTSCDDNSDVIGLNDATKYGFIKVTLKGIDTNGDNFNVTRNYRFAPSGTPEFSSSVYTYDDDGFYRQFDVRRYLGAINNDNGDNYADLYLYNDGSEEEPNFVESSLDFRTSIVTKNKEYFTIDRNLNIDEEDITSYQYNEESGKLSLKFSSEIPGDNNITGSTIFVTVNVNVTVFKQLDFD